MYKITKLQLGFLWIFAVVLSVVLDQVLFSDGRNLVIVIVFGVLIFYTLGWFKMSGRR